MTGLLAAAWGRLWPALLGAAAGQVVVYLKLKAQIRAHHLAQDVRARRLAARIETLATGLQAQTGKLSGDIAGLAETIRAVVRDQRNR